VVWGSLIMALLSTYSLYRITKLSTFVCMIIVDINVDEHPRFSLWCILGVIYS